MSAERKPRSAARWSRLDSINLLLVIAIAGLIRWAGIGQPGNLVFDEHYANDACLFVLSPEECPMKVEFGEVHPPLGKWLIGIPIRLFGFSPKVWRIAPFVAGTLSVAVLYLLARRLLGSSLGASFAAGLLTFDFLHFVMSRTAMLDIFVVFFSLAAFLCVVYDDHRDPIGEAASRSRVANKLKERCWLIAAGVCGGAALASKWSGGYLFAGASLMAIGYAAARIVQDGNRRVKPVIEEGVVLVTCLVIIPFAVYVSSYIGRLPGTLLIWPWSEGSWVRAFASTHTMMIEHHLTVAHQHPYISSAWSWPLIKRPVLFYFRQRGSGLQEVLAMGNPVVWWPGLVSLGLLAFRWRPLSVRSPAAIPLVGFCSAYLPWFVITRHEAFLYYFLPAVPFMYLAAAHFVAGLSNRSLGLTVSTIVLALSVVMFSFFWPLLAGRVVSYEQWERRMWFDDCGRDPLTARPVTRPEPPPVGWCWI